MLTTAPHLLVRRPSPTTAEFIVTTRPPMTLALAISLVLVFLARVAAVLGAFLLLYSWWALTVCEPLSLSSTSSSSSPVPPFADLCLADRLRALVILAHRSAPGRACTWLAASAPAWAVAAACAAALYAALATRVHNTESLLVLRGLGVQTGGSSGGGGGSSWLLSLLSSPGGDADGWWSRLVEGLDRLLLGGGGGGYSIKSSGRNGTRFIPTDKIRDVLINEAFRGFEVRYYLIIVVEGEDELVVVFPRLLPRRAIVEAVWRGVRVCLYERDGVVPKTREKE